MLKVFCANLKTASFSLNSSTHSQFVILCCQVGRLLRELGQLAGDVNILPEMENYRNIFQIKMLTDEETEQRLKPRLAMSDHLTFYKV